MSLREHGGESRQVVYTTAPIVACVLLTSYVVRRITQQHEETRARIANEAQRAHFEQLAHTTELSMEDGQWPGQRN